MKRVLIITYYWPPTGGVGVQRWLKMTKYLPSLGWQPVIYTPSNPERALIDESLAKDIPPQAEILTHKILEPYSIFRAFMGKKNSGTSVGSTAVNPINGVGGKSLKMRLALWIRANLFIPDPRVVWKRPSVKFLLEYLKEHPVDAIVSTGPPQSMHLIAQEVHRRTGIRWVADFRDPWTKMFYFKHLPLTDRNYFRHKHMERQVLLDADEVVTVTPVVQKEMQHIIKGGAPAGKVHLIENGFDEDDFAREVPLDEEFTILHTGLFSAEGNPLKLWKMLKRMCLMDERFSRLMRLELIGKCDGDIIASIEEAGLKDNLVVRGFRPHSEVNDRQKAARLLILPLRTEPEYAGTLTGKFYEYIAARRPIMAFGPHGSVLDKALTDSDTGRIFDWNEEEPVEAYLLIMYIKYLEDRGMDTSVCWKRLRELFPKELVGMPLYPEFLDSVISRYSRRAQAEQYTHLLDGSVTKY